MDRIARIKCLQLESVAKLSDETKREILQRIAKRQAKTEEEIQNNDPNHREHFISIQCL